jgi:hypothetical protein
MGTSLENLRLTRLSLICLLMVITFTATGRVDAVENESPPLMYDTHTEPTWLPRVIAKLKRNKPVKYSLEDYRLFSDGNQPTFLALLWDEGREYMTHRFELYSVTTRNPQDVRLHFVREVKNSYLKIVPPTGRDVFGDGVPGIFLDYDEGGSFALNRGLLVFRLQRHSIDVTPYGAGPAAAIVDDSGRHHVVAYDYRWAWLYRGCGSCSIFIPIFFEWKNGEYVPACHKYPEQYDKRVMELRADLAEYGSDTIISFLEINAEIALNMAQKGNTAEAISALADALSEAEQRGPNWSWSRPGSVNEFSEMLNRTQSSVVPALAAADQYRALTCPLAGYDEGANLAGAIDRAEFFR